MGLLDKYIIEYDKFDIYDIDFLKTSFLVPINSDEYYIKLAICKKSLNINSEIFSKYIIEKIEVDENDINFCLDDLAIKKGLYKSSLNAINNQYSFDSKSFLCKIIEYAIIKKSSDIHIECEDDSLKIKFRIDGILKTFFSFKKEFYEILSSLIKLISNLDITQKRVPQNGRFEKNINDSRVDFRVSTMPTINGESIVLRVLNDNFREKDLNKLSFSDEILDKVFKSINKSNGLILVTGPTGSGKTTTLYSILNELNDTKRKIITIEDPVEYKIKGISQVSINNEIGLKFEEVLKNVLRQDPDVIMIGEIRDKESLNIAIQASLTGHLVFSTLHTNDAISTITRLFDLDAKPFLISTTLRMVIAQRLVLKLCSCENGCSICNYSKFNGRIPLYEVLEIDDEISNIIHKNYSYENILNCAISKKFKTLRDDAKEKVILRLTSKEETLKVL